MSNTVFADGIGSLAIIDGVARIELVSMGQGPDGTTIRQASATLAMPLPAFVRAYQDLEKIINKLIADGVLQRGQQQPQPGESAIATKPAS